MGRVYAFSNENITAYADVYDFNDKRVLSVLGSGDHYFTSVLNGAKDVDVYDIDECTWEYFVFKYYSIMLMNYDLFYDCFIEESFTDPKKYEFVFRELPEEVRSNLEGYIKCYRAMYSFIKYDRSPVFYDYGEFIPYLYKSEFEKLKKILEQRNLPTFYNASLVDLPNTLNGQSYDLILTSNIYQWLGLDPETGISKYINILKQFDCPLYQAGYCWHVTDEYTKRFEQNGYIVNKINSSRPEGLKKDAILTLKREKKNIFLK